MIDQVANCQIKNKIVKWFIIYAWNIFGIWLCFFSGIPVNILAGIFIIISLFLIYRRK